MTEVSSKLLTGLLVVAVIVAVAGALISLDRIGKLGTGRTIQNATISYGTASVTIQGAAELTLRVDTVAFGSWQVNGTTTTRNCTLVSKINATTVYLNSFTAYPGTNSSDCISITGANPDSFELENTGNTNFTTVQMNSSVVGGAGTFLSGADSDLFRYYIEEEGDSCVGAIGEGTFGDFALVAATICDGFNAGDAADALAVQVNITIPSETPAQTGTAVVTFQGNV